MKKLIAVVLMFVGLNSYCQSANTGSSCSSEGLEQKLSERLIGLGLWEGRSIKVSMSYLLASRYAREESLFGLGGDDLDIRLETALIFGTLKPDRYSYLKETSEKIHIYPGESLTKLSDTVYVEFSYTNIMEEFKEAIDDIDEASCKKLEKQFASDAATPPLTVKVNLYEEGITDSPIYARSAEIVNGKTVNIEIEPIQSLCNHNWMTSDVAYNTDIHSGGHYLQPSIMEFNLFDIFSQGAPNQDLRKRRLCVTGSKFVSVYTLSDGKDGPGYTYRVTNKDVGLKTEVCGELVP